MGANGSEVIPMSDIELRAIIKGNKNLLDRLIWGFQRGGVSKGKLTDMYWKASALFFTYPEISYTQGLKSSMEQALTSMIEAEKVAA